MNEDTVARIREIEFEHRGNHYTFQCDVISVLDKGLWRVVVETPLSITKYFESDEDVVNICKLILDAYYDGIAQGKRDKQREICNALGVACL